MIFSHKKAWRFGNSPRKLAIQRHQRRGFHITKLLRWGCHNAATSNANKQREYSNLGTFFLQVIALLGENTLREKDWGELSIESLHKCTIMPPQQQRIVIVMCRQIRIGRRGTFPTLWQPMNSRIRHEETWQYMHRQKIPRQRNNLSRPSITLRDRGVVTDHVDVAGVVRIGKSSRRITIRLWQTLHRIVDMIRLARTIHPINNTAIRLINTPMNHQGLHFPSRTILWLRRVIYRHTNMSKLIKNHGMLDCKVWRTELVRLRRNQLRPTSKCYHHQYHRHYFTVTNKTWNR